MVTAAKEVHNSFDDQLNCLPAFEHLLFLIVHRFKLAAVLDVDVMGLLVHATVAQVVIDSLGFNPVACTKMLNLLVQCAAIVRVAGKVP